MLGDRIRTLRLARGPTQVQLAELAQVSRQLVGAVEADRHLPRVDAAVRLAAALSTTVEELLAADTSEVVGVVEEPAEGALVRIGRVGDRLVCVPAAGSGEGWAAADGQIEDGEVQLFDVERPAVVVAGCDPIAGLASRLLEVTSGPGHRRCARHPRRPGPRPPRRPDPHRRADHRRGARRARHHRR